MNEKKKNLHLSNSNSCLTVNTENQQMRFYGPIDCQDKISASFWLYHAVQAKRKVLYSLSQASLVGSEPHQD
jgi:hypothetical protein